MAAHAQASSALRPATYLRLKALGINDLPHHPELADAQSSAPTVQDFIKGVLREAPGVVDDIATYKFNKFINFPGTNQYPRVQTSTKRIDNEEWAARLSLHNEGFLAAASWSEFERGLKDDHSQHERLFTGDIFDCNRLLTWTAAEVDRAAMDIGFHNVTMEINEMYHKLPKPLHARVFTVLVLTASNISTREFYVVQIPVNPNVAAIDALRPKSHYVRHRSISKYTNWYPLGDQIEQIGKRVIHGEYVSIDRVTECNKYGLDEIKWACVTASDAKGAIPGFLQRKAVPGKIAHDVPYFLDWINRVRWNP